MTHSVVLLFHILRNTAICRITSHINHNNSLENEDDVVKCSIHGGTIHHLMVALVSIQS